MRRILYILLLVPLFFVPLRRVNVADLLPIETVAVYRVGECIFLETDTAHVGSGNSLEDALSDLKSNTPAVIYLDTAQYLIIAENALDQVDKLRTILKPSVKVRVGDARGDVKAVTQYLKLQKLPTLRVWKI